MIEYSDDAVAEAGQGYRRIEGFLSRGRESLALPTPPTVEPAARPAAFDAAMDDDFGVPQALAVLHEHVRAGDPALAADDEAGALRAFEAVLAMVDVLGLNPWSSPWADGHGLEPGRGGVIDALVKVVLAQRQEARARKDFAAADAIRDGLDTIGVRVEDTAHGVRWSLDN